MTEKKMRKWLKTFVMLLPVVFVVLFGVHLHRHELPESVEIQTGTITAIGELNTVYQPQIITLDDIYPQIGWTKTYTITSTESGFDNALTYYDYDSKKFEGINQPGFIEFYTDRIVIYTTFTLTNITAGNADYLFETTVYETYTEPLEVIAASFNNYLDMYTNNDIFNIDEFYDWSVRTFFNGSAPLYYKPIFSIMVYEFVVELLFLMFSFITFLIRFAQKWIDGLYERRF